MKVIRCLLITSVLCSFLAAQEIEPLVEKIKKISEELLEGYTQPAITAFGTGISTGLFHTAYSHDFLGFDLGVRAMYIQIPNSADYFTGTVMVCSLANDTLVSYDIELDSISTIFGPQDSTEVPVSGNAVGVPPYIPAGFDLSGVPLFIPQLNVGFIAGSELAVRYVPFSFKGSKMQFLGVGIKQELNKLPFLKDVPLPVAIAVGGAYQRFSIKDSLGAQIVNSRTWNLQILVSKRLVAFEPYAGAGLEGTKVHFHYDFECAIPATVGGVSTDRLPIPTEIDVELHSQNHYRIMAGFNFRLGFLYFHYDYNILPYATHNAILGITFM